MKIEVLSLFPAMFDAMNESIIGRAQQAGKLQLVVTDIRSYSTSKHRNTDDYPYGGGAGMLMTPQPLADAIRDRTPEPYAGKRILLSPRGMHLTQQLARDLSVEAELLLICGHYEGMDERIIQRYVDMEISIGDYVLTGGELPAMVMIDCIARLLDGVLGGDGSADDESFSGRGLLEYPQYTRPRIFEGMEVPEVLLNGNHAEIEKWRKQQSLLLTAARRPDLLPSAGLSETERVWIEELQKGK